MHGFKLSLCNCCLTVLGLPKLAILFQVKISEWVFFGADILPDMLHITPISYHLALLTS